MSATISPQQPVAGHRTKGKLPNKSTKSSFRLRLSTLISSKAKPETVVLDAELARQRVEYRQSEKPKARGSDRKMKYGHELSFACERNYISLLHDVVHRAGGPGAWMDSFKPLTIIASKGYQDCLIAILSYSDHVEFGHFIDVIEQATLRRDLEMVRTLLNTRYARSLCQELNDPEGKLFRLSFPPYMRFSEDGLDIALELLQFEFKTSTTTKAADSMFVVDNSGLTSALSKLLTTGEDSPKRKDTADLLILKGALSPSRASEAILRICTCKQRGPSNKCDHPECDDTTTLEYLLNHNIWTQRDDKDRVMQNVFYTILDKETRTTPDIVEQLLRHGASVDQQDKKGETILFKPIAYENPPLFENCAKRYKALDSHRKNKLGQHVVGNVCKRKDPELFAILLKYDPSIKTWKGGPAQKTCLMHLARMGWAKGIEILLEAGAMVNELDSNGHNALYHAALGRSPGAIRVLLDSGADPAIEDDNNEFAIHRVVEAESWECFNAFVDFDISYIQRGSKHHEALFVYAMGKESDNVKLLQDVLRVFPMHVDTPRARWNRSTPLFWAARDGKINLVSFLLDRGADPNCSTKTASVVALAIENGHDEVARMLLEAGADPTWTTHSSMGYNLLHLACKHGTPLVAAYLLDHENFDPNTPCAQGLYPLDLAQRGRFRDVVHILIRRGAVNYDTALGEIDLRLVDAAIARAMNKDDPF